MFRELSSWNGIVVRSGVYQRSGWCINLQKLGIMSRAYRDEMAVNAYMVTGEMRDDIFLCGYKQVMGNIIMTARVRKDKNHII